MLGKISVALLVAASPVMAQETAPAGSSDGSAAQAAAPQVQYKTKRVCRSVAIVGSKMPRTTCTTKKIPIKPIEPEAEDPGQAGGAPQTDSQL